MEDERTTSPPQEPQPATEEERDEAEDASPQDAPADSANDPEAEEGTETETEEDNGTHEGTSATPASQPSVTDELPRTTTTGDDEQDVRSAGDGAVSGAPGDDLDDAAQRHD
jgi:hypothetical protein